MKTELRASSVDGTDSADSFRLARKESALQMRAVLIQNIRLYFIRQGFLEVDTPVRIPAPAPEEHIEAPSAGDWFLQTSPEICMKRLLAAGYSRIFQISKCFRAGERGKMHLPEFSMLEWYVAGFDYRLLMDQCEDLLRTMAKESGFGDSISRRDARIDLSSPWERISVAEAFAGYAPVTLECALKQDRFEEILVEHIEPHLGRTKPSFLYDYPAELAALAKLKDEDSGVAERFELYIGSLEIANGFSELTDAGQQRRRFLKAKELRAQKGCADYPLPEKFLAALPEMPPSAGIALGIDRLVMLFTGAATIDDVVFFPPETL